MLSCHYMSSNQQLGPFPAVSPAALMNPLAIDRRRAVPLHFQIERALYHLIDQHFCDGDIFFKELEIAECFQVSRPTVRQALGTLTRCGLLERRPFIGTIVIKPVSVPSPAKTKHVAIFVSDYASEYLSAFLQQLMGECQPPQPCRP